MSVSTKTLTSRTTLLALCISTVTACSSEPDADAMLAANLETAEGMIDAFYSFDAEQLQPFLSQAGDSEGRILGYQAWAEGGNYIVLERTPCAPEEGGTIACPVKVQDDPVQALQTGFDVTDTFHLTFEDGIITNVSTSSNDQPIYGEARRWVAANMPEVMEGPCRREDNLRVTPGDCARAMTAGYAAYKANLDTAEAMIDAFYSFDPAQLQPFLSEAGDSERGILGYQAWAEGGNYLVLERAPCAVEEEGTIACPVTVQDDPVQALETGFDVTDTFHLSFIDGIITNVSTSSNDQPIYYQARRWVEANMPEVMEGPCLREDGARVTPGDCARAMTEGYRAFKAALDAGEVTLEEPEAEAESAFIPDDFEPPVLVEANGFKLVPLGPELVDIDYAAYMSSIEHLQETFTRSTSWPREGISDEEAMQDMLNEEERFNNRESFAYAVLTPEGDRERGCVYVRPSSKPGYDAQVALWVTKAEFDAGFDAELYAWTTQWVEESWPFAEVAYPGRAIEWSAWDQL